MKVGTGQTAPSTSKRTELFGVLLGAILLAACTLAEAQQAGKISRIGIVRGDRGALAPSIKIFQQTLEELGYVGGKNIQFDYRYTEGSRDQAAKIVAELVALKIDILFSTQGIVVQAAKQATKTIPIVMAITVDPVQAGLVESLARPGGNITGLTSLARTLSGKRLEILTEIIPRLSRVGFLTTTGSTAIKDYSDAGRSLKVVLQPLEVGVPAPNLSGVFQVAVRDRVGAVIVASVPGLSGHRKQIVDLAVQNQLPLMSESVLAVEAGGLAFYGANEEEIFRRAAVFVDKILKGAKPADLPVEQARKFDLVINLKAAKQIGLTIPPNVLARADRVIR